MVQQCSRSRVHRKVFVLRLITSALVYYAYRHCQPGTDRVATLRKIYERVCVDTVLPRENVERLCCEFERKSLNRIAFRNLEAYQVVC
jgi:hypothetical protein